MIFGGDRPGRTSDIAGESGVYSRSRRLSRSMSCEIYRRVEKSIHPRNDPPYDYLLDDGQGAIEIQVNSERKKADQPMMANQGYRTLWGDRCMW